MDFDTDRKYIQFWFNWVKFLHKAPDNEKLCFIKVFTDYVLYGREPDEQEMTPLVCGYWDIVKPRLDKDRNIWERNLKNGAKKKGAVGGANNKVSHRNEFSLEEANTDSIINEQECGDSKLSWRHLSSVSKDMLGWDKDAIAEFKKSLLREEVEALGILTPEGVDAFVLKWGEHNPGSETIRAEMEPVFNVQERARNYARIGRQQEEGEKPEEPDRFEDGKTYWLKDFTKEDLMGLDFDVRRRVLRRGAVKRMNGKWVID